MPASDLAYYLSRRATCESMSLYGQRVAERYDDETLAVLAEFPRLARLELMHHRITRFPRGLRGLKYASIMSSPELVTLDGIEDAVTLQGLQLWSLPALDLARVVEQLAELPELVHLSLSGEHLRELPEAVARLSSLADLELAYVPNLDLEQTLAMFGRFATIRVLQLGQVVVPRSIGTLRTLRALTVEAQGTLPDELGELAALERLHLEKATCKELPASIGKLAALERLEMHGAKITALPEEIGACRSLHTIGARSSALKTLPESIGKLTSLRELDAYNTKLKRLPKSMGELANLRVLELSYDKPLDVPDEVYQLSLEKFTGPQEMSAKLVLRRPSTPEAAEILLGDAERLPDDFGNVISLQLSLHAHTAPIPQLSKLPRVEQVTIDTGNLDDAFTRLAAAERLWRVSILGERETLPDSIGDLAQLTTLEIDSGPWGDSDKPGTLRALPAALGKLTRLQHLEIKRHRMTEPPEVIGELASLEKLTMRIGEMRALPRSIGRLQRLRELRLFSSGALRLPDELADCAALATVTLRDGWDTSPIENLEVLGRMPSLRQLQLVYFKKPQPWARLLAALAGSALEVLDLSDCELGELPAEIGGLGKLQRLELDNAAIKELPPELRRCTELRRVSWSNWRLSKEGRAQLKKQLPPGRWKKQKRNGVEFYERTG